MDFILFRCIVATLSYLHSRDKCHGNLKQGIFVTGPTEKQPRVCIANFNVDIGNDLSTHCPLFDQINYIRTILEISRSGGPSIYFDKQNSVTKSGYLLI